MHRLLLASLGQRQYRTIGAPEASMYSISWTSFLSLLNVMASRYRPQSLASSPVSTMYPCSRKKETIWDGADWSTPMNGTALRSIFFPAGRSSVRLSKTLYGQCQACVG